MKKLICLLFLSVLSFNSFSRQDSLAYQAQRTKVNTLLAERSSKFGQYDESLARKTGIFGWQTKKDIKNSNEILRQIVLDDNNIFKELKSLMEYKDLQNQQKVAVADNSSERIDNYMQTIKKLQDKNADLSAEVNQKNSNTAGYIIAFLVVVILGGTYFFNSKLKKYEKGIF